MRKVLPSILLSVFIIISCGKNLSLREAASKDVATNFLKSLTEGNIENAKLYVLSQLLDDESIKNFLSKKIESYEYIEEIEPLNTSEEVKKIIEKDKNKTEEIKNTLESYQKGLSKVINESMHIVKVSENGEDKFYGIFIFSSQNLKSITGIIDITEISKSGINISEKIKSVVM